MEHNRKPADLRLKLARFKAKNWPVLVIFLVLVSDFQYSPISDTQNQYEK